MVKLLLEQFPHARAVSREYGLLLQMAALEDDCQCVNLLLQRGVNINAAGYYYGTDLQAAAYKGNLNIVQQLLSAGADPNLLGGRYDTALRAAVAGGNAEIVDVLIHFAADIYLPSTTDGADPTKGRGDRRPTLVIACRVGKISIIDRLFSAGADVNAHSPRKAEEETSRVRGDF